MPIYSEFGLVLLYGIFFFFSFSRLMDSLNTSPFNPTSKRAFYVLFQKILDWGRTGKQDRSYETAEKQINMFHTI